MKKWTSKRIAQKIQSVFYLQIFCQNVIVGLGYDIALYGYGRRSGRLRVFRRGRLLCVACRWMWWLPRCGSRYAWASSGASLGHGTLYVVYMGSSRRPGAWEPRHRRTTPRYGRLYKCSMSSSWRARFHRVILVIFDISIYNIEEVKVSIGVFFERSDIESGLTEKTGFFSVSDWWGRERG